MKKINIIWLSTALFLMTSCGDLLEETPKGNQAGKIFFTTEENALTAVSDLYNAFGNDNVYTRQAMMVMEFGTDLGTRSPHDDWPTLDPISTYTHNASAQRIGWVWRDCFAYIQNTNIAIASIEGMSPDLFKKTSKDRLIAEVRFIRAFLYFHLTNFFGDLPALTAPVTSPAASSALPRTPSNEIRKNIVVPDLEFAIKNLPEFDEYATSDQGRISLSAAKGLLAKVYLFEKNYTASAELCKQLYESGKRGLLPYYPNVFSSQYNNSKESLLAIQALIEKKELSAQVTCYGDPTEDSGSPYRNSSAIAPILSFASYHVPKEYQWYDTLNDNRWKFNFKLASETKYNDLMNKAGVTTQHLASGIRFKNDTVRTPYIVKFCDVSNRRVDRSGTSLNFPILRWADILLIYSESLNENNQTANAFKYINEVRKRAYTNSDGSVNPGWELKGLSQEQLRAAILKERALELCFEGHRRFDLSRTNTLANSIQSVPFLNETEYLFSESYYPRSAAKNVKDFHRLFGVPTSEITLNPNLLPQNPGY